MKRACSLNTNTYEYLTCEFHPANKNQIIFVCETSMVLRTTEVHVNKPHASSIISRFERKE